jgi:hypothetical protein
MNVNGSVILADAELAGLLIGAFVPQMGDLFFIINNDGIDPVQGQFLQGTSVTISGMPFAISYTGDVAANTFSGTLNGNDVVLRAVPEPTVTVLAAAGLGILAMRRRRVTGSSQKVV